MDIAVRTKGSVRRTDRRNSDRREAWDDMNLAALRYEELALNAFSALHTEVYDGWLLRFAQGAGYPANCVIPLYLSTRAYEDKIAYCEEKFSARRLPCVFKMTANVASSLDQQLALRGYEMEGKTRIMECALSPYKGQRTKTADRTQITLSRTLEPGWLEALLNLEDMNERQEAKEARIMLEAIRNPVYCAAVYENSRIVGCGLGVLEDGKIGLYDIRVEEGMRKLGIGSAICRAIMEEGAENGADTAYLQVGVSNRAALALYESLGFNEVYTYWYRVRPDARL